MIRKAFAVKSLVWGVLALTVVGIVFTVGPFVRYRVYPCCYSDRTANKEGNAHNQIDGAPQNNPMSKGEDASAYQRYAAEWAEPMVLLTIVLAVGVITTAIIYYKQLKKMEAAVRLSAEQAGIMKDSLSEARKMADYGFTAAKAAWKGVEQTERQFKHDQRARLISEGLSATVNDKQVLRLVNTGKLTADPVDVFVDIIVLMPSKLALQYPVHLQQGFNHAWHFNVGTVRTVHDIEVPLAAALNDVEIANWKSGNLRIIAQIQIEYGDGFGEIEVSKSAYRSDLGQWKTWPTWAAISKEDRIAEEYSRYHPV